MPSLGTLSLSTRRSTLWCNVVNLLSTPPSHLSIPRSHPCASSFSWTRRTARPPAPLQCSNHIFDGTPAPGPIETERESGRDLQCRYRKERRVRKSSFPSWIDQTRKRSRFETLSFWAQTKICELHNSPYPREFWPIIRGVVYSSHLHPPAREVNWKVNGNSTLPLPPSSCAI